MYVNIRKFLLELSGATLIILVLSLAIAFLFFKDQRIAEIIAGYLISLFIFMPGFLGVNWGLKKSLKTFLVIVLGGMFLRFVFIGVTLFLLMRLTDLKIIYFICSFLFFYLICQFYEIRFINLKLSKGRKWLTFSREAS